MPLTPTPPAQPVLLFTYSLSKDRSSEVAWRRQGVEVKLHSLKCQLSSAQLQMYLFQVSTEVLQLCLA